MSIKTIFLYINTVKKLKLIQIIYRFKPKRFFSKKLKLDNYTLRTPKRNLTLFDFRAPSYLGDNQFIFLNKKARVEEWGGNNNDKLWLYNLHYFDYVTSSDCIVSERTQKILLSWINSNPIGVGIGWEPYPTSLRIVNWIYYLQHSKIKNKTILDSLSAQVEFLFHNLEYHLLGNHLFANAKALLFGSLFFECQQSTKWFNKAISILRRELKEQILADGGNFELSPMYHNTILTDVLQIYDLLDCYGRPDIIEKLRLKNIISKMLFWAKTMEHPDGNVSFFNDSAIGISATTIQLVNYAKSIGLSNNLKRCSVEYLLLRETGYFIFNNSSLKAILDLAKVGPDYIPGHAHADTLSFELSIYGKRVFVNSGTSKYGVGKERLRQRGTSSHNTVVVNGVNSSEVWSGFRVARRAYPSVPIVNRYPHGVGVRCSHNGYNRLPGRVTHTREWIFTKHEVIIIDNLTGDFESAVAYFHIHPDVKLDKKNSLILLSLSSDEKITVEIDGTTEIEDSTWHPEFGISIPNKKIKVRFHDARLKTVIRYHQ